MLGGSAAAQAVAPPSGPATPVANSSAPPAASGVAPPTLSALEAEVNQADLDLHALSKSFGDTDLTNDQIKARLAAIAPIQAKLDDALSNLAPPLADAQARLAQLGPPPAAGQPREAP